MLSLDFTEDDSPPIPALDGGEESVETIAVRTKLNPWKKKKKNRNRNKNVNSNQFIN